MNFYTSLFNLLIVNKANIYLKPLYRGRKLIRTQESDRYNEITSISEVSITGVFNITKAWKNLGLEHPGQYFEVVTISVDTKTG